MVLAFSTTPNWRIIVSVQAKGGKTSSLPLGGFLDIASSAGHYFTLTTAAPLDPDQHLNQGHCNCRRPCQSLIRWLLPLLKQSLWTLTNTFLIHFCIEIWPDQVSVFSNIMASVPRSCMCRLMLEIILNSEHGAG